MDLPVAVSVLLIVAGLWNLVIWPQFLRRVVKDPRARDEAGRATTFLTVHLVLVSASMALGLAVGIVGIAALV
jgi:MFS superfamily sulfate permease-like transporter